MKNTKSTKKTMTTDQLAELEAVENALGDYRDDVATQKANVREAEADTREAQANLKKEKNHLAKAEKDVAATKKSLAKLKAKYKGWARPKADAFAPPAGTGDGSFDQVADGLSGGIP